MAACSTIAQLLASHPVPFSYDSLSGTLGLPLSHMRAQDAGAPPGSNQPSGEALETKIMVCKCPSQVRTAVSTVCCDIDRPLLASFHGTPYVHLMLLER
jgi:hypothetical protein